MGGGGGGICNYVSLLERVLRSFRSYIRLFFLQTCIFYVGERGASDPENPYVLTRLKRNRVNERNFFEIRAQKVQLLVFNQIPVREMVEQSYEYTISALIPS